jgi:hypothetical protein
MEEEWQLSIAMFCPAHSFLQLMWVTPIMYEYNPFKHAKQTLHDAMHMNKFPNFCTKYNCNLSIIPQEISGERLGKHIIAYSIIHQCPLLMRAIMDIGDDHYIIEYCMLDDVQIIMKYLTLFIDISDIFYLVGYKHFPNIIKTLIREWNILIWDIKSLICGAINSGLIHEIIPLFDLMKHTFPNLLSHYENFQTFVIDVDPSSLLPDGILYVLQNAGIINTFQNMPDINIIRNYRHNTQEFENQCRKLVSMLTTKRLDCVESAHITNVYYSALFNTDDNAFAIINQMIPNQFKKMQQLYVNADNYEFAYEILPSRTGFKRDSALVNFLTMFDDDFVVFRSCEDFIKFMNYACKCSLMKIYGKYNIGNLINYARNYYGQAGVDAVTRNIRRV